MHAVGPHHISYLVLHITVPHSLETGLAGRAVLAV